MKKLIEAAAKGHFVRISGNNQYYKVNINDSQELTIHPVGGGFVRRIKTTDESIFEVVESLPTEYKKGVFSLDGEFVYEGYSIAEKRWNGWAIPVFELSVAKEIMKKVNSELSEWYEVSRNDDEQYFEVIEKDWEQTNRLDEFTINVEGKDITVVHFMGGNWTWDDHYGVEAEQLLAKHNINNQ
ncbi:hypothetical protein [Photobacterium lutimaris]|uniref:Uncharacterized protein n=1 Tax=Photobacterium lutimaris TaxID=388278 RepID=A0A2T3ITL9_9GAMM|nr:hypothetical protein [Photobacterium lutimaris]PSU31707.1 hypothetical protein C9I99_21200 [Photobacterium lutimaris]TDR72653.1 hypothetical protein DFP78_113129 [Photobacterium lutimaris]